MEIKQLAPQRWQDTPSKAVQKHEVVIAFEERIYDAVIEDLQTREPTEDFKAIHVICLDTKVCVYVCVSNLSIMIKSFLHSSLITSCHAHNTLQCCL